MAERAIELPDEVVDETRREIRPLQVVQSLGKEALTGAPESPAVVSHIELGPRPPVEAEPPYEIPVY